jgi:hypothetical protein
MNSGRTCSVFLAASLCTLSAACFGRQEAFYGVEGTVGWERLTGDSVVVLAAGDIAVCDGDGDERTAAMLDTLAGTVLTLGDHAYRNGTAEEFRDCYDPTWGRHKGRTHPTPGNHEYHSPDAAPYFAYFGAAAGPAGRGYYSFELGAWHVISLNSNVAMDTGSPQDRWLRADLAAHPRRCTLAFWHHPRFSSGPHGPTSDVAPLWRTLAEGGVDVVLQGHDHGYERFVPMTAEGTPDSARGIRSFVVGGGGAPVYPYTGRAEGSQSRYNVGWGIGRFTLRDASYEWELILASDGTSVDHGGERCR